MSSIKCASLLAFITLVVLNWHQSLASLQSIPVSNIRAHHSTSARVPSRGVAIPQQQQLPSMLEPVDSTDYRNNRRLRLDGSRNVSTDNAYFSICTVMKDENPDDIREWVQYHQWLGTQKFYIFDHESKVPALSALEAEIRSGLVEYHYGVGHHQTGAERKYNNTVQAYVYSNCLDLAKRNMNQWMAFIDLDEFLVLYQQNGTKIGDFLSKYEAFGGLVVNWRMFGSSGHSRKPAVPTLEAYTHCHPKEGKYNGIIKSIVHVPFTTGLGAHAHVFKYVEGKFSVTETFQECQGQKVCPEPTFSHIGLHHYVVKSLEQFQAKMQRGGSSGIQRTRAYWKLMNRLASDTCPEAVEASKQCFGST